MSPTPEYASHSHPPTLRSFLVSLLLPPSWTRLSDAEAVAFEQYRDELMRTVWPRIGLLLAAAALVWWPMDWVVYANRPGIIADFARLRVTVISINILAFFYANTNIAKRWTIPSISAFIILESFVAGYSIRKFGGLDGPWVHYFNIFPIVTILLLIKPWARVVVNFLMYGACLLGMLIGNWQGITHRDFPSTITFAIFIVLFSSFLGHLAYELFKSDFVLRRRLDAKHHELHELTQELESRVAAQTQELRRLARHNEQIREEERRAIAREIHDQLGQKLTAIRFGLFFTKNQVVQAPTVALRSIDEVLTLTSQTSETVRRLHTTLHPRVLEELGLFRALEWLVREMTKHSDVAIDFDFVGEDDFLALEVAAAIFRCAQEGMTNVLKHAHAERAQLSLEKTEKRVYFRLKDNGDGPPPHTSHHGLGLIGIRERAQALGGQASWTSSPEGGFSLSVEFPLTTQANP